jgi:hypothetical protein
MTLFRDGRCDPLRRWPEWAQILGFAACALFVNLAIGMLISYVGLNSDYSIKEKLREEKGIVIAFLLLVVVGPYLETSYGQWLPLIAARIAKRRPVYQLTWAAVWFAILHITEGIPTFLQTFGVGWVLASSFMFCRDEGWLKAYRVTSTAHAVHNLVVFIFC